MNKKNHHNLEGQLQQLGEQLRSQQFDDAQARVEMRLRAQWKQQANDVASEQVTLGMKLKHFFTKKRVVYGGASLVVFLLAAVTTISMDYMESSISSATGTTTVGGVDTQYADVATSLGSSDSSSLFDNFFVGDSVQEESTTHSKDEGYAYTDDEREQQAFRTDISLELEIDENVLWTIEQIHTHVQEIEGYVMSTAYNANAYYPSSGTIYVKVPNEQLSAFQQYVATLDTDGALEVLSYNVQNMSEEVTTIDSSIQKAKDAIEYQQKQLQEADTEYERTAAENAIAQQEKIIKEYTQQREETITKYEFTNVSIQLMDQKVSQWDDTSDIDTSTFWGELKYEFLYALSSLVDTLGGLMIFIVWIAVYSIILVPLALLIRWGVRRVKRYRNRQ